VTRRPRTLRRQLLTWLVAPLIVLWTLSTWIDFEIANRFVRFAYDRALLESALDISRQVKVVDGRVHADLPEVVVQMLRTRQSGAAYYLVTGPDNEYITGDPDLPSPPDPRSDAVYFYDGQHRGKPVSAVAMPLPIDSGGVAGNVLVRVAEDYGTRTEVARQIMIGMMIPQGVLIVLAALAVWYAIGRGLAPLNSLQREISARSHRDLSALSAEQAPREVRPLIQAMNDLLGRLSKALASQQRLIGNAAHQLRTPIAGIKTQTELALRQARVSETRETLQRLQAATEQATRMINQLLALARAEPGGEGAHTRERLDLAVLARDTTSEWVPRAIARDIDLGLDSTDAAAPVEGDPFLLREMLNNLLDNALSYTQRGGRVTVRVTPDANRIVLSVEDNGPGVPEAERDRVFERFYRVLGTGVEGCGLGLAIVQEIAQRHGADAVLTHGADGTGTLVRVGFPRAA